MFARQFRSFLSGKVRLNATGIPLENVFRSPQGVPRLERPCMHREGSLGAWKISKNF
jgi:hypothetical protein